MTREEEMWEAVEKEHGVLSRRELFVTLTAMEWADKKTINKAIDILIDLSNDGCLIDIHNHEEFEKQFRKKMEE